MPDAPEPRRRVPMGRSRLARLDDDALDEAAQVTPQDVLSAQAYADQVADAQTRARLEADEDAESE